MDQKWDVIRTWSDNITVAVVADADRHTVVATVSANANDIASVTWTRALMARRVSANISAPSSTTSRTRDAVTSTSRSIHQVQQQQLAPRYAPLLYRRVSFISDCVNFHAEKINEKRQRLIAAATVSIFLSSSDPQFTACLEMWRCINLFWRMIGVLMCRCLCLKTHRYLACVEKTVLLRCKRTLCFIIIYINSCQTSHFIHVTLMTMIWHRQG